MHYCGNTRVLWNLHTRGWPRLRALFSAARAALLSEIPPDLADGNKMPRSSLARDSLSRSSMSMSPRMGDNGEEILPNIALMELYTL
jgi:hypothetical protein